MYTSSCKKPWRKAFLTSSCLTSHFEHSNGQNHPNSCSLNHRTKCLFKIYPFKLRESPGHKYGHVTISYLPAFNIILNIHFESTKFIQGDLDTNIHVLLVCETLISSCIGASQWGDLSSSLVEFGSLKISLLLEATRICGVPLSCV